MKRSLSLDSDEHDSPKLDISSLIDATFLLLCFFLVTSTLEPLDREIPMELPRPERANSTPLEVQKVTLRADGAVFLGNGEDRLAMDGPGSGQQLPILTEALKSHANVAEALNQKPFLVLEVDDGSNHQRVMDVLNAIAAAEITNVSFVDWNAP